MIQAMTKLARILVIVFSVIGAGFGVLFLVDPFALPGPGGAPLDSSVFAQSAGVRQIVFCLFVIGIALARPREARTWLLAAGVIQLADIGIGLLSGNPGMIIGATSCAAVYLWAS